MQMDGKKYSNLQFQSSEVIVEVLEKAGKTKKKKSAFVLHQANKRIVCFRVKTHERPLEKYPMNIENLGKYILRKHSASPG